MNPRILTLAYACSLAFASAGEPIDVLNADLIVTGATEIAAFIHDGGEVSSKRKFKAPVQITYELQTDGDVRLGYAADQIILNWSRNEQELRVNGGPVDGQHVKGGGFISKNELVTITQTVLADRMTIEVNGVERASWQGKFSKIREQIRVFPHQSNIVVKQILVQPLPSSANDS